MSYTRFKVNLHSIFGRMSKNCILEKGAISKIYNKHSTIWPNGWGELLVRICTVYLTVCSCHATYPFKREFPLYIRLNVKKLLSWNSRYIWSLSDWNRTRTHSHLVRKRSPNYLGKLTKWYSWIVNTYLYGTFYCMFLSCHVRLSEWIHTLYLSECQATSY